MARARRLGLALLAMLLVAGDAARGQNPAMVVEAVYPIPRSSGTVPNVATDLTFGSRSGRLILVNDSGLIEVPLPGGRPDWSKGFAAATLGFQLRGWAQDQAFDWVVDAASLTLRRNPGDASWRLPDEVRAPTGLAYDGAFLWLADAGTNRLYQFAGPRTTPRLLRSYPAGTRAPVRGVAFGAGALWATDGNSVYLFDREMRPLRTLPVDRPIDGIAWIAGRLWACALDHPSLLVLSCPAGVVCPK